jgi:hypothetical protein
LQLRTGQFLSALSGESAIAQSMEITMKKIMYMVALGLALISAGQAALAYGVRTGSPENEESGEGSAYMSGHY